MKGTDFVIGGPKLSVICTEILPSTGHNGFILPSQTGKTHFFAEMPITPEMHKLVFWHRMSFAKKIHCTNYCVQLLELNSWNAHEFHG